MGEKSTRFSRDRKHWWGFKTSSEVGENITCNSIGITLKVINVFIHWHIGGDVPLEYPNFRMRMLDATFMIPIYSKYLDFDINKEKVGWHRIKLFTIKMPLKYYDH